MINTQTNFMFGAIGDRMDFDRSNEVYMKSAKSITNAYISNINTLRVMKDTEPLIGFQQDIINVKETDSDFLLVVHPNQISTITRNDSIGISTFTLSKTIDASNQVFITRRAGSDRDIENNVITPYFIISIINTDGTNDFYKCGIDGSNIEVFDLISIISKPLTSKNIIYVDVYRVYNYSELTFGTADNADYKETLVLEKIGSKIENPLIELDNGKLRVDGLSGEVRRIYFENNNDFIFQGERLADQTSENKFRDLYIVQQEEDTTTVPASWTDLTHGDIIVNFYNYDPTITSQSPLLLLFKEIEFSGLTDPASETLNTGKFTGLKTYYTDMKFKDGTNTGRGRVLQGDIIPLQDKLKSVNVFRNRLVLLTENTLYFSRTGEFEDFTNDIEADSPFYQKLSPIRNVVPNIIASYADQGLYVLTDRGVNVVNYQEILSPADIYVTTPSQIPCSWQCESVNGNFFYVGKDENLYCVKEDRENVDARLYDYKVEKYQMEQSVSYIDKIKIEREFRLIVCEKGVNDKIKLYTILNNNNFSNVEYEFNHQGAVFAVEDTFFADNIRSKLSTNNKNTVDIVLHQPDVFTNLGGSLFNDQNTVITKMTSSIINTDNDQVQSLSTGDESTLQLGAILGRSSLYSLDGLFQSVVAGIPIKLTLNTSSTGIVEISGFEYFYNPNSRY